MYVNNKFSQIITCNNIENVVTILARGLEDQSKAPFFWIASYVENDKARLTTEDTIEYTWSDPVRKSYNLVDSLICWQLMLEIRHGSNR